MRERTFKLSKDKTVFIRSERGRKAEIAKSLEITPGRLGNYLLGSREIPETQLLALCRATDKMPSDFIEDKAEKILADSLLGLAK